MRRRLTTEERENIEERFRGETLYRYAGDVCLPFVRGLKTFRLSEEEFFVAAAEALDNVKEDPDEARYVCQELCDSLQRDFREMAGDEVPDEEITLAVVCVVTFVSVCLSLMDDSTCRSCVMDLAMGLEEYACGGLDREARERMLPSIWRRGEGGLKRWIDEYWRSGEYLTDVIHDALHEEMNLENDTSAVIKHPSGFRIAKNQKTNFAKIISAMFDLHMFEDENGKIASSKQKLLDDLGAFFGTDFKNLSQLLNAGKQNANYTEIFDKLKNKAEQYDNK